MMAAARGDILGRLGSVGSAASIASEAAALLADLPMPPLPEGDLADAFLAKLAEPAIGATYGEIPSIEGVPRAVARYLEAQGLARAIYLPPDPVLTDLDWAGFDIHRAAADSEAAALALADLGVAETGTLVFETGPQAPMLPNFVCLHHLVVLHRTAIAERLEAAAHAGLQKTRARYWVSGVSGTTDIEGQYVRGAHGPRFLHVLLVGVRA